MASYKVFIKPSSAREVEAVDHKKDRQRLVSKILSLAENPRPHGCEKLVGERDRYRVRVGRFRVLYSVEDEERFVVIVRVGHRKDAYR